MGTERRIYGMSESLEKDKDKILRAFAEFALLLAPYAKDLVCSQNTDPSKVSGKRQCKLQFQKELKLDHCLREINYAVYVIARAGQDHRIILKDFLNSWTARIK